MIFCGMSQIKLNKFKGNFLKYLVCNCGLHLCLLNYILSKFWLNKSCECGKWEPISKLLQEFLKIPVFAVLDLFQKIPGTVAQRLFCKTAVLERFGKCHWKTLQMESRSPFQQSSGTKKGFYYWCFSVISKKKKSHNSYPLQKSVNNTSKTKAKFRGDLETCQT